nr:putative venom toxin Tcis29 [Tityus cisandinus]
MQFSCFILILFSLTLINTIFFDMKAEARSKCLYAICARKCISRRKTMLCMKTNNCECPK